MEIGIIIPTSVIDIVIAAIFIRRRAVNRQLMKSVSRARADAGFVKVFIISHHDDFVVYTEKAILWRCICSM